MVVEKFEEKYERSIVKAITYRGLIVVSNAIVIYFLTKNIGLVFDLSVTSVVLGTVIYYFHERIWNHIHWGKVKR